MSKETKKPIGRPRIHLQDRKRRNLNIERDSVFDFNISVVREMLAKKRGVEVDQITKTEAVKEALDKFADLLMCQDVEVNICPRCNGAGYIDLKGENEHANR